MREIKFRAWDKIINEWVYFTLEELCNEVGDFSIMKNWCQYTGLKDKNGREIFERDIVKWFNEADNVFELGKVIMNFYSWVAHTINKGQFTFFDAHFEGVEFEVIGNIYENPKLLKKNE